ncbi:hypothetical protein D3C85_1354490 [compost metagenome]
MTTNKCTDWIDARDSTDNRKLRTAASFTRDRLDLNSTSFHFWNFLAEKIFNELLVAAAQNKLRATIATFNILDKHLNA